MMHVNDPETGIIMFTTEGNIEYICQPDVEFFGDGIFKYCPRYFYRLYTLLGHKNGRYVPCTNTVNRQMELAGRTNYHIYISNKFT
jgi:hypothetical protein